MATQKPRKGATQKSPISDKQPTLTDQEKELITLTVQILTNKIVKGSPNFDTVKENDNKKATKFPL